MSSSITLGLALRNNLLSLQRTQSLIDKTTLRLATGLKVNSALDNPQNYFAAQGLDNRASDLSLLLDGIGQNINVVKEASSGLEGISELLHLAKAHAQDELDILNSLSIEAELIPKVDPLSDQILAANPAAYWRLNETSGTAAVNLGSIGAAVDGSYNGGAAQGQSPLYDGGDVSTRLDGGDDRVDIPNNALINAGGTYAERTVELVFNADTTVGRQVLYEEGGTVNAFSIYIDDGRLYVNGRDQGAWGPANISVPIDAGETYHVAFTFSSISGEFIGYLDGEEIGRNAVSVAFPSHTGAIAIGRMSNDTYFHDGPASGNGFNYDGRISDVALYNDELSDDVILSHAKAVVADTVENNDEEFDRILDQITQLAADSSYRGLNLLTNDVMKTFFNEERSHYLASEGDDMSADGLGILREGFSSEEGLLAIIGSLDEAIAEVRSFASSLANDLNILSIRDTFTRNTINTLKAGADDLTVADMNEEGSNLLALQTRQQLGVTSLSLAAQSAQSVLSLFA